MVDGWIDGALYRNVDIVDIVDGNDTHSVFHHAARQSGIVWARADVKKAHKYLITQSRLRSMMRV